MHFQVLWLTPLFYLTLQLKALLKKKTFQSRRFS